MWNDAFPSFLIGLREGLEAGLIVSILVATLVRADQRARLGAVWAGVGAAAALSLSFAAVLTFTAADLPAGGQDVFGGVLSLIAVGFVTTMVFWMRKSARSLSGDLRARVTEALGRGAGVLVLTSFIAVAREGLETSLFLWTTAKSAGESQGPMIGAAIGIALAVVACWGLYRRVLKINLTKFFSITGAVLIVIAAGVLAYGLGDLQEGGLIPGHTAYAFNLTSIDAGSWYATLIAGTLNLTPAMSWLQVIGYLLYLPPTMFLFVRGMRSAAAASKTAAQAPAAEPATPLTRAQRRAAARVADEQALAARIAAKREAKQEREAARRMPRWAVGTSIFAVPAVAAVAAIAVLGPGKSAAASNDIALSESSCGTGWTNPEPGAQTFNLTNNGHNTAEVYLISPSTNAVFAEIENLAPGTTRPLTATLSGGSYAFRCAFTDGTALSSKTYMVGGGSSGGSTGFAPVTDQDLQQPVADYRAYVQQNLLVLLADSQRLAADLAAGNVAAAKTDWLTAHLDYEGLGAAYGTFENFDAKIDGRATGLQGGVNDPSWTGFHRIEYGLWHGQSAAVLKPLGDQLVADVQGLIKAFPSQTTDPNDLPLRTHEILENTLQFQLTGISDYGSGTALATASANLHGTQVVLSTLVSLMQARDPQALKSIDAWIQTVAADLNAAQRPDGSWTALDQLTATQRQKISGDLGELLEQLSVVPDLLEERSSA
ncbi:iron uptake transporter permease EfeU [Actinocrinis sp.]|uniref:iron uptake transporter permease EfeU n=1 Tax=Actinocrinis sp. TaxID=1920516 RepID=UPI002D34DB6B|nr:iron uptake transporter permease EfeU [Actinocrinis sp.]HZP50695.1 iron uptake transporter permease EfeU [Actinocrinis sp.]